MTRILRRAQFKLSNRANRWLLGVAAILFLGGSVIAWRSTGLYLSEVRAVPLVLAAVVGVPLMTTANAIEFRLSSTLCRAKATVGDSFRTAVLATAANLLPLPGGVLVRLQAIRLRGGTLKTATAVTIGLALIWLGLALGAASTAFAPGLDGAARNAGYVLACLVLIAGVVVVGRISGWNLPLVLGSVSVELLTVAVTVFKLVLIGNALNTFLQPAQAALLGVAPVVSTLVAVFPAGLGLRELIAATLGPVGGVPADISFVIVAVDRIVGMVVNGGLTLAVMLLNQEEHAT